MLGASGMGSQVVLSIVWVGRRNGGLDYPRSLAVRIFGFSGTGRFWWRVGRLVSEVPRGSVGLAGGRLGCWLVLVCRLVVFGARFQMNAYLMFPVWPHGRISYSYGEHLKWNLMIRYAGIVYAVAIHCNAPPT